MAEKQIRSVVKSISWRILATLTTVLIVFILTGSWRISLGAGLIEIILKIILSYFHERLWNKLGWGLNKQKDENIIDDII